MVYIKLTNEMWVVSGLEKLISPESITTVGGARFIAYSDFSTLGIS